MGVAGADSVDFDVGAPRGEELLDDVGALKFFVFLIQGKKGEKEGEKKRERERKERKSEFFFPLFFSLSTISTPSLSLSLQTPPPHPTPQESKKKKNSSQKTHRRAARAPGGAGRSLPTCLAPSGRAS